MKIFNEDKGYILADDVIIADNYLKRMKGLLGSKKLSTGEALILKPCNSIHTFFMHFAIDVLFVDKDNKVIKAITNLKPFRITPIYFKSAIVIEMPAGAIALSSTTIGDTIIFQ